MKRSIRDTISLLKKDVVFGTVITVSLSFFLYKGILYAAIGSIIPLSLILIVLLLFILSLRKSERATKRTIGLWAILLIIWSSVRIALSVINQFVKPIPEGHVAEQLGIMGLIQSLAFLIGALYLWKNKSRILK
ncbi:hypothetical protein MG296_00785 [Flavobacteriaceae bacterium TK19130]|nr:hypothetical protein [Thermobacterium salinum]